MTDWRVIPDFPRHKISEDGQVLSPKHGLLRGTINSQGYLQYTIGHNYYKITQKAGFFVLWAFVGPPNGLECCHNDGNRRNDHISNLRWDTHYGNMHDRSAHGRTYSAEGENNAIAKFKNQDIWDIRNKFHNNATINQLSKEFFTSPQHIRAIVQRRIWRHI